MVLHITDSRFSHEVTLSSEVGSTKTMTYEKDHHYFLNRFGCVCEFFDRGLGQF